MNDSRLSRRSFLWRCSLLAAGLAGLAQGCRRPDACAELSRRLAKVLDADEALAEIGRAYLRAEESLTLEGLLTAVHPDFIELEPDMPDPELAAWLGERIARDLREDRVVRVARWDLSVTEARLSALSVLLQDAGPIS